jgi:hypothetical protein
MAQLNKFSPVSPDTFLKAEKDMALAKFGHLNAIVDANNTLDTAVTAISSTTGTVKANSITEYTTGSGVKITGQELNIISGSGANVTLITQQSGSVVLMDRAAGITFTLPTATATSVGMYFDFVVTVTGTATYKIVPAVATELLIGGYTASGSGISVFPSLFSSGNKSFSMDSDTKGRLTGTKLRFTCLSTTLWSVEGIAICAGTAATAFSTSV